MKQKNKKTNIFSLAVITYVSLIWGANGALIIDITEGNTNNAIVKLTGTGTILANGGSGSGINIVTDADTFITNGSSTFLEDPSISSPINLGSGSTSRIFIGDLDGNSGFQSRIGFGGFSADFVDGNNASDLNGTYTTDLAYSNFVEGSYVAKLGFLTDERSMTDIGAITINVGTVPEPSSVFLLGLGSLAILLRRKKTA